MKIGARVTVTGPPLAETLGGEARAVRREVFRGMSLMGDTGVGYWRGSTPIRTGRLRASERATVTGDPNGNTKLRYHVEQPGADYYVEVADKYEHLEDLRIVDKWTRDNERTYIDLAIRKGLKE